MNTPTIQRPQPRSLARVLEDLIAVADRIAQRPPLLQDADTRYRIGSLGQEIEHFARLPADARRTTSAAEVMVIALREAAHADRREREDYLGGHWMMLAGATLPLLRAECFIAIRNEREQRA